MQKSSKKNKSNRHLFQLIKSLSKTEKRYFKIYLQRNAQGENSASEKLFNAIDKQKNFDEHELRTRFKDESFVNNLSVAKNRLTENILRALHFYHHEKSDENKFNTLLNEIEILYNKSLLKLCQKKIAQAKILAQSKKDPIKTFRIAHWEQKLNIATEETYTQKKNALHQLKLESRLNNLNQKISIQQTIKPNFKKEAKALTKMLKEKSLSNSLERKIHASLSRIFFLHQNFQSALEHAQLALKLLHPKEIEEHIHLLSNIIFLAVKIGQFDKAKTQLFNLRMLRQEFGHIPFLKARFVESIGNLDLLIKSSEKRIQCAIETIPQIATELAQYNGEIQPKKRASFYINFAQLYFLKNEFKSSLRWSNELLNYKGIDCKSQLYLHGMLFNMIVHNELGNTMYIASQLKFIHQKFEKARSLGPFEDIFFKHISQENINFGKWQSEYNALSESEKERSIILNFEFEKWLESKVRKMDMIYLL